MSSKRSRYDDDGDETLPTSNAAAILNKDFIGGFEAPAGAIAGLDYVDFPLVPETELRIHVPTHVTDATVQALSTGLAAECLGSPVPAGGTPFPLVPGSSLAITTWTQSVIRIMGNREWLNRRSMYRGDAIFTKALAEIQCHLEYYRHHAQQAAAVIATKQSTGQSISKDLALAACGPRVIICGSPSSGKHTALTTLANLAARFGWPTTVMDADPSSSQSLGWPGSIASAVWEHPTTINEGSSWFQRIVLATGSLSPLQPLVLPPGGAGSATGQGAVNMPGIKGGVSILSSALSEDSGSNSCGLSAVYLRTLQQLINATKERLLKHADSKIGWAGCSLLLPSLPDPFGALQLLIKGIQWLDATHVYVVGDDGLFQLSRRHLEKWSQEFGGAPTMGPVITGSSSSGSSSSSSLLPFLTPAGVRFNVELLSGSTGALIPTPLRRKHRLDARIAHYFKGCKDRPFEIVSVLWVVPLTNVSVVRFVETIEARGGAGGGGNTNGATTRPSNVSRHPMDALFASFAITGQSGAAAASAGSSTLVKVTQANECERRLGALYFGGESPASGAGARMCCHIVKYEPPATHQGGSVGSVHLLAPIPLPKLTRLDASDVNAHVTLLVSNIYWSGE